MSILMRCCIDVMCWKEEDEDEEEVEEEEEEEEEKHT